jgi:excisionase family DNA binding protein
LIVKCSGWSGEVNEPVYTTGDVAKFTGVNFRTVIRWIERGELSGYKLPGRGDHRVTKSSLVLFMVSNGMPVPLELSGIELKSLIVDDNAPMASAIARVLKRVGWQVQIAGDGFEAGMQLISFQPSLLILDLRMPTMDGFSVLASTRDKHEFDPLKILVVSGQGQGDLDRALKCGANAALAKPFSNEQLLSVVEKWFSN